MTGAQALTMLMARLSRSTTTLRANALLEMNQYQIDLEKGAVLPDFLIVRDTSITLTAGNRLFTLPAAFLRELDEDETLWIIDADGLYQPMEKVDYEDTQAQFDSDDTSELPLYYTLQGLYGYTFPIPSVNRTLKMSYYAVGTAITDASVENVWLKHASDLLIAGTGTIITSLYVKDSEAALAFAALEARAKKRLLDEQTARQEAGRSRRMG